jgi:hypothetical protein
MIRRMLRRLVLCVVAVALCGGCGSKSPTGPTPAADFASQFDALWSTFDRQYSYFDYKHIDWNALREAYRPRALAAADQTGFIAVIREMLGQLHDLHVVIRDPSGATIQTYDPHAFTNWDRSVWDRYIARAGWTQGQIDWGHGVLDGVPYIVIGAWSPTAIRVGDFDAAFERYRNAPLIIVDVRMNSGGDDSIAYDIAGRFTSTSITAGFAKFRDGASHSSFGALMPRVVNPRGSWQYGGKVLLLIGQRCVSSNESFIAAMSRLPNVTLMGDRTGGASANPMSYPLANGWTYTVSRWIEYTADQQVIEDVGIAPRIAVPSTAADFAAGRDPVLDAALSMRPSS